MNLLVNQFFIPFKKLKDNQPESDPKSNCQLLIDRHQGITAAGMVVSKVSNGDGVHGGELDRIEKSQQGDDR